MLLVYPETKTQTALHSIHVFTMLWHPEIRGSLHQRNAYLLQFLFESSHGRQDFLGNMIWLEMNLGLKWAGWSKNSDWILIQLYFLSCLFSSWLQFLPWPNFVRLHVCTATWNGDGERYGRGVYVVSIPGTGLSCKTRDLKAEILPDTKPDQINFSPIYMGFTGDMNTLPRLGTLLNRRYFLHRLCILC